MPADERYNATRRHRICLAAGGAVAVAATSWSVRRYRAVQQVPAEIRAGWLYLPTVVPPMTPWPTVNRATLHVGRRLMRRKSQVRRGVMVEQRAVPGPDDVELTVYLYRPRHRSVPGAALLWIHGGDLVVGDAAQDHDLCSCIAACLDILVVSVDYRLAPEHPFPAAHDDCYAALRWLSVNAGSLHVDPERIAVGGASAGGGLAATVAQHAHDDGLIVAFQLLVYPMLDDRTMLRVDHGGRGRIAFTPALNRFGWRCYLGRRPATASVDLYAAAARRRDLTGLPPAWLGVGSLDLLHDEAVEYAHRLQAARVPCRLHVENGMYHGADVQFATSVESMKTFRACMIDALADALLAREGAGRGRSPGSSS